MTEDLSFTFNTSAFENGMKNVGNMMSGFKKGVGNMAKSVSKGIMGAAAKVGLLFAAFKGVKGLLSEMPEIGQAFGIAKNIFLKNLLFPLRKAVFPMLQKLVSWVRDNRQMFVKWGAHLVNMFHTLAGIIGKVIDLGKTLVNHFLNFINSVFGTSFNNIEELFNVLTFKFAVMLTFASGIIDKLFIAFEPLIELFKVGLKAALDIAGAALAGFLPHLAPIVENFMNIVGSITKFIEQLTTANEMGHSIQRVFETIGNVIGSVIEKFLEFGGSLFEGFFESISQVATPLQKMADQFERIWTALVGGEEASKTWNTFFKTIGELVGSAVMVALEAIAGILGFIVDAVEQIQSLARGELISPGLRRGIEQDIAEHGKEATARKYLTPHFYTDEQKQAMMDEFFPELKGKASEIFSGMYDVDDAIITKDGKVIKTNPEDMIIATKGLGESRGGSAIINIDFTGQQIILQQGTSEEATAFASNLVEQFRNQLNSELERMGMI